jgi:arylsulfatase A-like enzyme
MKPNILIIVIDSLRSDKCFGDKSLQTPNINLLIKKGVYCSQTISSIPGTVGSLGCMFTGEYSFKTGINTFQLHSKIKSYLEILKDSNYNMYATIPNTIFFNEKTKGFNDRDMNEMFDSLDQVGKKIIKRLESDKMKEPWTYYIHLMDLHVDAKGEFRIPNEFNKKKYGDNEYDRIIFFVDYWLGKIFEKINFDNTLVVITADHGHVGKFQSKTKIIKKIISKGKIFGPRFYKMGKKLIKEVNMASGEHQEFFKLSDAKLLVPLIFAGYGINKHKIVNQLVRNLDIFPTIADIIGLSKREDITGRTILPLFQDKELKELPIYIENSSRDLERNRSVIGLRNSNYKYYRDQNDPNSKVNLYDLKNDPDEIKNIALEYPDITLQMEENLKEIMKNSTPNENSKITDEEAEIVKNELKKLGYI